MTLLDPTGYADRKRALVGGLRGRVLEIGAGRGSNFALLHPDVAWTGLEPHARSRRELERRAPRGGVVLAGRAEAVPLDDGSVDAVLATVVLCSVASPARALAEARRVLRPGGTLVFLEHVASPRGTWRRAAQRVCSPAARLQDHGCDLGRETWRDLEAAGFARLDYDWFAPLPGSFPLGPRIVGSAGR